MIDQGDSLERNQLRPLRVQLGRILRFTRLSIRFSLILLLILTSVGSAVYTYTRMPTPAYAATSSTLNFQARLMTSAGNTVPDGYYNIQFNLYDVSTAGSTLWTETRDFAGTDDRVRIVNGFLSVNLGSVNSLPSTINWDQEHWLGMTIRGAASCDFATTCTPADSEMTPRLKLTAMPYAFRAGQADNVRSSNTNTASTNSAAVTIQSGNTAGVTSNSGNITLTTGNATSGNSGNVTLDVGTSSGTAGSISIGTANASSITLGRVGVLSTLQGNLRFSALNCTGNTNGGALTADADGDISCTDDDGGGSSTTLQNAYDNDANGSDAIIALTSADGGVLIRDNATPLASTLFAVQNSTGATSYLSVDTSGIGVNGSIKLTGSGAFPGSPTEGQIYYRTDTDQLYVYTGSKWQADRTTATKIVGTSASGGASSAVASQNPDAADFVNTSTTSAQTTINSAISALPATGGTVYLMEGTYIVDGTITLPSNITFVGSGSNTILKIKNSNTADLNILTDAAGTETGITVSNIKLDGNKANNASNTHRGVYISTAGSGTGSSAVAGISIDKVWVEQFRNEGITLGVNSSNRVRNSSVTNSYIIANTSDGVITGDGSEYNRVENNSIQGNGGDGVELGGSYTQVIGNTLEGNTGRGVGITTGSFSHIASNMVRSNAGGGILTGISGGGGGNISGNQVLSNTGYGISVGVSTYHISGNHVYANTGDGINAGASSNHTITANRVTNNGGNGIFFQIAVGTSSASNNFIESNGNLGIRLQSAGSANLTGNTILSNAGGGIQLDGSASLVSGNRFENNGGSGGNSTIFVDGNDNTIIGNHIYDGAGTGYAIEIRSTYTGTYISDNLLGTGANGVWNAAGPIRDLGIGTRYGGQQGNNNQFILQGAGSVNVAQTSAGSGTLSITGSYYSSQIATPSAPTAQAQGTTGATTYKYKIVANDGVGDTLSSAESSGVTNGNATLTGANFNRITWNRIPGAISYKIYRSTAGGTPSSTGLIGTVLASTATMQLDDTGLAASGAEPTINSTGGALFQGGVIIKPATNTTTAFQIQNAAGTSNLFVADTVNNRIGIGTNAPGSRFEILGASGSADSLLTAYGDNGTDGNELRVQVARSGALTLNLEDTTNVEDGAITLGLIGNDDPAIIFTGIGGDGKSHIAQLDDATGGLAFCANDSTTTCNNNQFTLAGNNGAALFKNSSDSATAFQIQNVSSQSLFSADTTNRRITLDDGSSTTGNLFVVDAVATASLPTGVNGGILYDSTDNKLKVYENGAYKTLCNTTDLGCSAAGTLQQAYTADTDGSDAVIALTSADGGVLIRDNATPLGSTLFAVQSSAAANYLSVSASAVNLGVSTVLAANQSLTVTGGATGSRPGSPTEGMIFYDTTTKQLLTYANGKWQADRSAATKTVGTSAAGGASSAVSSQNPDAADYVNASDTSAQTVINSAIAALPAEGGTVYLMEGTYIVDASINLTSNLRLVGAGPNTIIKVKNAQGSNLNVLTTDSVGTKTRIAVENLRLEGNKGNVSGVTVHGIVIDDIGSSTLPGISINRVWVENFETDGIRDAGSSSEDVSITNSFIIGNLGDGVRLGSSTLGPDNSRIEGNSIVGNGGAGINIHDNLSYLTVSNNTISDNTGVGIILGSTVSHNTISGNTIKDPGSHGITLGLSTDNNNVSGNTIYSPGGSGISMGQTSDENTITSNGIYNSTTHGIFVYGSGNLVSSNIVEDSGSNGIDLSGIVGQSDNQITNNKIRDASGSGYAINIGSAYASTYVAGNTYQGTYSTSGAVNDASPTTIYGGQINSTNDFVFQGTSRTLSQQDLEVMGAINGVSGGVGQYGNLLTYSEQFDNAAWTKTSVTATANSAAAPDGITTADTLDATAVSGTTSQTSGTASGSTYTYSVWLRSLSGTRNISLRIDGATTGTGTAKALAVGTTWQRYFVTQNTTGFTGNVVPKIIATATTDDVYAWGAQMVVGSSSGVYAETTASTVTADAGIVSNGSLRVVDSGTFGGDLAVNGGDITSAGALNVTPAGALTLGATGQTALLQGTVTTITSNGAGNDIILTTADKIILTGFNCTGNVNGGALTASATGELSCSDDDGGGSSSTLQDAYDASTTPATILLSAADDNLLFQNPASGGLDIAGAPVLKIENLATGNVEGLRVESAGTGNLFTVRDTTATATDVFKLADGGAATFQNQTDSTSAFAIQRAGAGGDLFVVDTTNSDLKVTANIIAQGSSTATTATTSGTGTNTTTLTFSGTTSFANDDVLYIDNAGQDYYTRIVSGGTAASVTVSPAVTFETARTVTKYNVQNIGSATNSTPSTNNERFFQGYFLGGVVTGAGSTTLSDGSLQSTTAMNFTSPSYTFKNSADTSTAFRIQNAAGSSLLSFNTNASGPRLEVVGDIISKGTEWTSRTPFATTYKAVAYGNGLYVAVAGVGSNTFTSPDGINWTGRSIPEQNAWTSITYGNGLFVAVSEGGTNQVMTSPDGITWTARAEAQANAWQSVTYGNGLFVAVSYNGGNQVMTSSDGITWTAQSAAAAHAWYSVTYGNGLYVALACGISATTCNGTAGSRVMTSSDGVSWSSAADAADISWKSVTYGNGLFVAVAESGTGNRVMTSPDGTTWTSRTSAADNNWKSVTYGNGLFVAVAESGTGNRVMTSPDGTTWTSRTSAADNNWKSVTYGNGQFVAVSDGGTNRAMTSGKMDYISVQNNNLYQGGITVRSGAVSLNDSSTFATTINTGTSTGAVTVGNSAAGIITLQSGNATANAITINASNAAGGINIDAGSNGITLDTTGAISLDSTALLSNFNLAANSASNATLTIGASNAGAGTASVVLSADEIINLNAPTIDSSAVTLALFGTPTTINFGAAVGVGGINFAGGSSSTGCTIFGSTGSLTCTGNIRVDDANAAAASLLVLDSSSATPTAVAGGMYFDTGTSKFKCSENGSTFVDCIGAGGSGTTLQGAYDASTTPATILLSAADDNLLFQNPASGGLDVAGAPVLKIENLATGNIEGLRVESAGTGNLFTVRDTTATATDVFAIADGGFVTFSPQASLTSGQTHMTQTLTNASSSGGTINGYSQTITVAPTGSASTTRGFVLAVTDATTLANTTTGIDLTVTDNGASGSKVNTGLKVSTTGSNTGQSQIGLDSSTTRGIAIRASTTGAASTAQTCGNSTATTAALCADSSSSTNGNAIVAHTLTAKNGSLDRTTAGIYSINRTSGIGSGWYSTGIFGEAGVGANTTGSAIGVYGSANSGSGAAIYGGYFALGASGATLGSSLYATNNAVAANILQLQDNTTNVLTVGDGGATVISSVTPASVAGNGTSAVTALSVSGGTGGGTSGTTGQTAGSGSAISLVSGAGGAATGASGANTGGAGGTVAITSGAGGAATSGTGAVGGAVTITAGNGGNGSTAGGSGGSITLAAGSAGTGGTGVAGSVIVQNAAASSTAFLIRNTSSQSLFTADTTNRRITLDDGQAALANLFVLDSSSAAPTAVAGGMYFDTGTSKFKCSENGSTFVDCIGAGGTTTLQGAYDASTTPATILLSAADDNLLFQNPASGGLDIAGAPVLKIENLATGNVEGLRVESAGTGNLFTVRDTTATATDVFAIADGGFVTFSPQASLTAGQTHMTQTLTNGAASGAVIGYNQTLTVAPSAAATTQGIKLALTDATTFVNTTTGIDLTVTDNGASGAKINTGLKVTLNGSNTSQRQVGADINVNAGIGLRISATGGGGSVTCNNSTGSLGYGVCASSSTGVGIYSWSSSSSVTTILNTSTGVGVVGATSNPGTAGGSYRGVVGDATVASNAAAYNSVGILGMAGGGVGSTAYGGYFTVGSGNSATLGAALYATTPTYTAAGAGNGRNAVNVLQAAGGTGQAASATTGVTAGSGSAISLVSGAGGAATGASGANTGGAGGTVAITSGAGGAATSGTGAVGGAVTITAGNGGNGSTAGGSGGSITLAAGSAGTGGTGVAGSVIVQNAAASSTAFLIRNTSSQSLFTADTTNRRITLDDGQAALANLFVLDSSSAAPTAVAGGMYFDTSTSKFKCSENGSTFVDCIGAGGSTDLQGAYANDASGEADIVTTSSGKTVLIKAGSTFDSATLFHVQNAAGNDIFGVDTSAGQAVFGKASTVGGKLVVHGATSGNITISTAATVTSYSLVLPATAGASGDCLKNSGTAGTLTFGSCGGGGGGTAKSTLIPEFAGAVLTPDGTNNLGTMTTDFCSKGNTNPGDLNTGVCVTTGDYHSYYSWTANATNDYDIYIPWQVPSDFSSFTTSPAINFYGWRTSTSDAVTLTLFDDQDGVCGAATSISGTVATWNLTNYATASGCGNIAAGDLVVFKVTVSVGVNNEFARMGKIEVNYNKL